MDVLGFSWFLRVRWLVKSILGIGGLLMSAYTVEGATNLTATVLLERDYKVHTDLFFFSRNRVIKHMLFHFPRSGRV